MSDSIAGLCETAGLNVDFPWGWIPEDGAACSLPAGASLMEWSSSDGEFFGSTGGELCNGCPFSAANSVDGVGKCAGAAIVDNDGAGHWFGVFGGLTPKGRADIAWSFGLDVPEWVEAGVEAGDGRHGSSAMWVSCKCEVCRAARSAWRRVNESRERSPEVLARRAKARRERYAVLRASGLTRDEARRIA